MDTLSHGGAAGSWWRGRPRPLARSLAGEPSAGTPGEPGNLIRRARTTHRAASTPATSNRTLAWIADGEDRSAVRNSLAILVRVMEQAVRDGLITVNPARVRGWQRQYQLAEDELDEPRSLALRDWNALEPLATARVARSHEQYAGWGHRGLRRLHDRPHGRGSRHPSPVGSGRCTGHLRWNSSSSSTTSVMDSVLPQHLRSRMRGVRSHAVTG